MHRIELSLTDSECAALHSLGRHIEHQAYTAMTEPGGPPPEPGPGLYIGRREFHNLVLIRKAPGDTFTYWLYPDSGDGPGACVSWNEIRQAGYTLEPLK